jgi:type IX secretion system PorP/SprF family membrane protein
MKRFISLYLLLSLCIAFFESPAQDAHFSQFYNLPTWLNPANNGNFRGDYRLTAIYRNQWNSISEPFTTFAGAIDGKAPFKEVTELSLGISFLNDQAGAGNLNITQGLIHAAYHFALNRDSNLFVHSGVQLGFHSRQLDFNRFTFDEQYRNSLFSPSNSISETFGENSFTELLLNGGISFSYQQDLRNQYELGLGIFNLNQPNQSFLSETIPLDNRTTLYLRAQQQLNEKLNLEPSLLYSTQSEFQEIVIGSNLRYYLDHNITHGTNVAAGIWLRLEDALIPYVDVNYKQYQIGVSYDINISDLEVASNQKGGIEISLRYIFSNYKPTLRRFKQCPRFI